MNKETSVKKEDSKKNKRCFVMMPFTDPDGYDVGHFQKIYDQIIKPAIEESDFEPYRVDDNNICDSIISKIFDAITNCEMAVCDLSGANPNVLYELGLRQAYDKPVVLIQDEISKRIFDVSGISTVQYKKDRLYENVLDAKDNIKKAIKETYENTKVNSLVNVMKAKKAIINEDNMTEKDKVEIKLDIIMNELNKMKATKNNYDSESVFIDGTSIRNKDKLLYINDINAQIRMCDRNLEICLCELAKIENEPIVEVRRREDLIKEINNLKGTINLLNRKIHNIEKA